MSAPHASGEGEGRQGEAGGSYHGRHLLRSKGLGLSLPLDLDRWLPAFVLDQVREALDVLLDSAVGVGSSDQALHLDTSTAAKDRHVRARRTSGSIACWGVGGGDGDIVESVRRVVPDLVLRSLSDKLLTIFGEGNPRPEQSNWLNT